MASENGQQQTYRATITSRLQLNQLQRNVYTLTLLLAGILAGAVVGICLLDAALTGDGMFYTAYKQLQIRALILLLPVLGGAVTLISALYLYLIRHHKIAAGLTSAAILCFILAAFVTFRFHFPLNAQIMTWSTQTPPNEWMDVQAQWWQAHLVRTGAIVCGYVLLLLNNQALPQAK